FVFVIVFCHGHAVVYPSVCNYLINITVVKSSVKRIKMIQNPLVYLDIAIGIEKIGRVILELFKDKTPLAAENFRALCTGEKGIGSIHKKPLHYKGTIFHKAISQFMIQGGDNVNFDGTGGESIYGHNFIDESFEQKHDRPGLLSMANSGPNTNSSQFFITTVDCEHLNDVNVVFGQVRAGMGVVQTVADINTEKDHPVVPCSVVGCGEILDGDDWGLAEWDESQDPFPPFPNDLMSCSKLPDIWFYHKVEMIAQIKNAGNYYFSKNEFENADQKYRKALRYVEWYNTSQPPEKKNGSVEKLRTICQLNLAACKLKARLYREALNICDQVLQREPGNAKAFYRRGQAQYGLNDYELALKDLKKAKQLKPCDTSIIKQIKQVKTAKARYLVQEKIQCSKMFK
ncbi:hypothetical protein B566_EDAN001343, partial [Ephemera danica]